MGTYQRSVSIAARAWSPARVGIAVGCQRDFVCGDDRLPGCPLGGALSAQSVSGLAERLLLSFTTIVYYYFDKWQKDGTWWEIHERLHCQVRQKAGRDKHPTGGCLDSQSVKTTAVPGERGCRVNAAAG